MPVKHPAYPLLAWLALAAALLAGARAARADDTAEVRKVFRAAQREANWKDRRAAYVGLLDYDGAEVVDEVLKALARETNAAVVLEAVRTLGAFESAEARAAILEALAASRGDKAHLLLLALAEQKGPGGEDALLAILADKDAQAAALAALALGHKASEQALGPLLAALQHKEWQVVSAAARALRAIAWSARTEAAGPGKGPEPAMPAWFVPTAVLGPLVDALEGAAGRQRGDLIDALEAITRQDLGDNLAAWRLVARGEAPDEATLTQRVYPPYLCGVPVFGRRVVIVQDVNVRTDEEHPFTDRARLQELVKVPGARDIPWYQLRTVKQFISAHTSRLIQDLPTRDVRFDLILSGLKPKSAFGKLTPCNAGTQRTALTLIEKISVENGNDVLGAMTAALDIAGRKDSVAWAKGPDEVLCVYASVPWLAEETDTEVIGATIGLKARLRLVPVHAIGVREFAYQMLQDFAAQSGGRYVAWTR